ncbi:MAG: DUF4097 domain-containing protein [bacterium]
MNSQNINRQNNSEGKLMRLKIVPVICLTFFGLHTSLIGGTIREQFEKTFKFKQGGTLILENTNGSVAVESWSKEEVRVEAEKIVKAKSRRQAEEIMKKVRIDIKQDTDYLEIQTHIPRHRTGFWDSIFGGGTSISVTYYLKVPHELRLDISTVNGGVEMEQVGGEIRVKSTNGRIRLFETQGVVDAKTTNGSIEVDFRDFEENEDMSFKTTNGGIKLYLPENFRAYVNASTTNGSINTDFPIKVHGEISKRRLRGEISGGGGTVDLHTTNGSIRILKR